MDKSKAAIIENLQIKLKYIQEETEQNLKVRKLESLEQNMEDKHAEVATLKRTLDRRDEKINQMEQEMLDLEDKLEACIIRKCSMADLIFYKESNEALNYVESQELLKYIFSIAGESKND